MMELECRINAEKGSLLIALPMAQLERAYMLFDALREGLLNGFILHDKGRNLVCQYHVAGDVFYEDVGLLLSPGGIGCIKRMLLSVLYRPMDTEWLHVDIEADGGDISVRVVSK